MKAFFLERLATCHLLPEVSLHSDAQQRDDVAFVGHGVAKLHGGDREPSMAPFAESMYDAVIDVLPVTVAPQRFQSMSRPLNVCSWSKLSKHC